MSATYDITPTLVQCFGIIFVGLLVGKLKYITPSQGKGVEKFCVGIVLPVLIFKAMVEVDFSAVKWSFWFSLLLAKALVFFIVLVVTLLLKKDHRYGAAGLYSIFVTQSNDFAFGLPVVKAMFHDPKTESLVDYIFLAAPINLAILNPIAFSLLEYQKAKDLQKSLNKPFQFKQICLTTVKGVVTNPLVFTIGLGIGLNFALDQQLPTLVDGFFTSLSDTFVALALFILGLKLGSQQNKLSGLQYALPVILVIMKSVILPIILILVVKYCVGNDVDALQHNSGNAQNTTGIQYANSTAYSTFAFLYGTIPTAPTVLLYAAKYNVGEQLIGSGLVVGTIFSAPIIFASVKMLQVNNMVNVDMFDSLLGDVSKSASIVSVVSCVYALCVLIVLKSYKQKPHRQTMIFILFQLLLGLTGALFEKYSKVSDDRLRVLIFFLLFAMYSCPVWYSAVAIQLSLISFRRGIPSVITWILHCVAFCVPFAMALYVALKETDLNSLSDGSSYYFIFSRFNQHPLLTIAYTILHVVALLSCTVAIFSLRKSKLVNKVAKSYKSLTKEENRQNARKNEETEEYEPILTSTSTSGQKDSTNSMERWETIEFGRYVHEDISHVTHHVILLLVMFFVILLNSIIALWCNVEDNLDGMTLELIMLSVVLTYGQGFFSFAIFGFLKEFYGLPCFEWLYYKYLKLRGKNKIILMNEEDLDGETVTTCKCFVKHHIHTCSKEIVSNLRFHLRTVEGVFTGTALVDWLIKEDLANNRADAVLCGNSLLQGRILEHYSQQHFFYDLPYFYRFTDMGMDMSVSLNDYDGNQLKCVNASVES